MTSVPVAYSAGAKRTRSLSSRGKLLLVAVGFNMLLWAGIIAGVRAIL